MVEVGQLRRKQMQLLVQGLPIFSFQSQKIKTIRLSFKKVDKNLF